MRTAALPLVGFLLAGCAGNGGQLAESGKPDARIAETWVSPATPSDDLDSLAVWKGPAGEEWVVATAKQGHRLAVFDVGTGQPVRGVGGPGSGPGSFQRPNGIAIAENLAFVVERDNRRVQVLRLPGFETVGQFGGELRYPYGLTLIPKAPGRWDLWVTDDYAASNEDNPPLGELGERLRRYEVIVDGGRVQGRFLGNAGATAGAPALRKVESILADPEAGLMLVADELDRNLEVYDLEGQPLDRRVEGIFNADPEGIALYRCDGGEGYWIVTEQIARRTRFHILDRKSLRLLGTFAGERTANTDGIALTQQNFPRFPQGALFALQNDQAVSAFDWRQIAEALGLRADCGS